MTEIKTECPEALTNRGRMGNIIFKCPHTGLNVQYWLDDAKPEDSVSAYETVICKACGRLHFINRRSGKLLGQKED